jgi:hypothetical protein
MSKMVSQWIMSGEFWIAARLMTASNSNRRAGSRAAPSSTAGNHRINETIKNARIHNDKAVNKT